QIEWLVPRGVVVTGGHRGPPTGRGTEHGPVLRPPAGGWLGAGAVARDRLQQSLASRAAVTEPDAACTIVLSSGTTGSAHGVVHSQRALLANARAVSDVFLRDPRDVRLAWLPASHALARVGDFYTAIVRGGCLNVVGDRRLILAACRALPPTVILGVPAFFERLEAGVRGGRLDDLAMALGGQVRVCVSGGAPLRRRTAECFAARGVPLVEGYGLAEAGPVVSLSNPRIARPESVGPAVAGVEVRIDERPASRGQLLVRTPGRALGLVAAGASVATPLPEWIETGDLASLDADGHLRITGRLKDVIALATGTKLPPAEVERTLAEDEAVAQVCVVGDGLPWPVALVVPEPAVVRRTVRRLGLPVFTRSAALRHPRLLAWFARRLARRQRELPRAWRVRRMALVGRAFDAAHGEATESLKLRRDAVAHNFAASIAALAGDRPPRGCVAVDERPTSPPPGAERGWLVPSLWTGGDGGFAWAAAATQAPLATAVEAVLERAMGDVAHLRAAGGLYEPPSVPPAAAAPIPDPPPTPRGRFSSVAEQVLGEAGLWGLAVPEAFGGAGGSVLDVARAVTRLAAEVPTAAGMLAVHSSIGAVSALVAFGTAEQQARHLPGLAAGRPLSIFAATEADAGCDLSRVRTHVEPRGGRLRLTGTKMFITGAAHGRLVKVLALRDGAPIVLLVRLPDADTPTFRLRHYALHPLKHAANAALEFSGFEVDEADVLVPPAGDALAPVWHGLNRGRTMLAAQAAGTLRLMLGQALDYAGSRETWSRPIASRQLVQGRLGRIAAAIVACDAISGWAATAIDSHAGGEWEAIVAKVVASRCVREAAIDALGIHGGRAFLVGHPLGDSLHDHFAVGVYEGESDLLGLALFRGLAKAHPLAGGRDGAGRLAAAAGWLAWRAAAWARSAARGDAAILDRHLQAHASAARRGLVRSALAIDAAIRRYGRGLAERQLEIAALSDAVRELASVLAVVHHADMAGDENACRAADCWSRLALARAAGRGPSANDLAAVAALGASACDPRDRW
ncbi:MAG: AMP-binding protein, partial [Planctomycetes bacterium]|nr:AMP-binding protein [Planctomycetota bacterium]